MPSLICASSVLSVLLPCGSATAFHQLMLTVVVSLADIASHEAETRAPVLCEFRAEPYCPRVTFQVVPLVFVPSFIVSLSMVIASPACKGYRVASNKPLEFAGVLEVRVMLVSPLV